MKIRGLLRAFKEVRLHKKHAVAVVNGWRIVHGTGFRADERRFAEFHEAERVLTELARRR